MADPALAELPVAVDLNAILLDVAGLTNAELEALVLQYYQQVYLDTAQKGIRMAHDGEPVVFYRERCTSHAFHQTIALRVKGDICPKRVQRVLWIREYISGRVPGSFCYDVPEEGQTKRIYCYFEPPYNYVIWLKPRNEGGFKFDTAYDATAATIGGYVHRPGARLIARF